jgi:Hypothetical glycosyl hydrolase family 15
VGDWQLQMNRVLGLVRRGKVILAQSYLAPSDLTARGFVLGSYLLIKGSHTFLNMDIGQEAQWFPEYGVDLGQPVGPPPANISALRAGGGVYVRKYAHGLVAVNPDSSAASLTLSGPMQLVRPVGGGALNAAADTSGWGLRLQAVRGSISVPAHGGVVLLRGG